MIRQVRNTIKGIKPEVRFGVSPRGVWKNKMNDSNGSDTGYAKEVITQIMQIQLNG